MNKSVVSTIEKIKLQEQDNENRLKEKREYESTLTSLNRAIKEGLQRAEKYQQEQKILEKKVDDLSANLVVERTRNEALLVQVEACHRELNELNTKSDQEIKKVWELRASLCTCVQEVADSCDVRALLIKPMRNEFIPSPVTDCSEDLNALAEAEDRLKFAIDRREKAIRERNRLQAEPDEGEEFIRIKNALQYSMDMLAKLNDSHL